MTSSQRIRTLLATLGCIGVALPALAEKPDAGHHDADVIEVVSTNVQGKNVYIPSTIVVEEGRPHTLSIFNTTDVPHGFAITSLGVEVVLKPGEETRVELPTIEHEGIHEIHCQLHPAHRTARLVVIDMD
jgi:heme/copper-type cytochrome/quinol oxidase subunit 2